MKFLVVLAVTIACASAGAVDEYNAPIVKSEYDINPDGAFQYAYETGNGIYAQAQGVVKNQNSEYPALEVKGGYKYTAPNGEPIELTFTADEFGYQPVGSHLPVPPPTPEAILRGLAFIAANPPAAEGARVVPKPAYG